tara:strand:- start:14900 stop:15058 length:159 start_codon:yes stop_codon:yes gene_type:complete
VIDRVVDNRYRGKSRTKFTVKARLPVDQLRDGTVLMGSVTGRKSQTKGQTAS